MAIRRQVKAACWCMVHGWRLEGGRPGSGAVDGDDGEARRRIGEAVRTNLVMQPNL